MKRFRYIQDEDGHLVRRDLTRAEEKAEFAMERMIHHDNRTIASSSYLAPLDKATIPGA